MSYTRKPLTEEQKRRKAARRRQHESAPEVRAIRNAAAQVWRMQNQEKVRAYREAMNARRPGWQREWHLVNRFGITPAEYDRMLAAQNGGCAICGVDTPGGRGKHFHVDHDHATNRVRALLCTRCNTGIGSFGESTRLLRLAISYLQAHQEAP